MHRSHVSIFLLVLFVFVNVGLSSANAQTQPKAQDTAAVAKRLKKRQTYRLQYKFKKDERVRWNVVHAVSTKVQMAGETEESSSRSETGKVWTINNVDVHGNITFVHSNESINMWQQVGEDEPVAYDSTKDKEIPEEYESVAETVGKPLSVFTIQPDGTIVDRKSALNESSFGVGKVTIPLPKDPIAIGHQWYVPSELRATDEYGNQKKIKARVMYELMDVRGQNASIKFKTEILMPNLSEKIKSTIMQQMTDGYIVFNVALGRPVIKQVQWDEKAQGFEGPDSLLTYVGKMTEKLVVENVKANAKAKDASSTSASVANRTYQIKTSDGSPVLRK
ncbi:MAG: hypothetical protein AAFN77_04230 [Planctomycetota bacterium]